jgi:hypothetical protein
LLVTEHDVEGDAGMDSPTGGARIAVLKEIPA